MNESRHVIAVRLDEHALSLLFRDGATVRVVGGIPKDARLLGVWTDHGRRCFVAAFEHPSFPEQPEGTEPALQRVGFEIIEHPMADMYDMIPLKINMDEREALDMQQWICRRAAEIEGRDYERR